MALDNAKNFAKGTVFTGYTATDTSIVLSAGNGAKFPTPPFNAVWWNATDYPDPSDDPNVEIVRATAITTDTLTVTRAQEGTTATAKNIAGKTYKILAGLTAKTINNDSTRLLYAQTSVQAGDTVTTSANDLFASHYTIPANSLQVGDVVELEAWGLLTCAVGDTFVAQMMVGSNYIGNLGKIYQNNAMTNSPWRLRGRFIVTSTGASGTIEGTAEYRQNNGSSYNAPNQLNNFEATQPVASTYTLDTTVAQALSASCNSAFAAGSSATQRGCVMRRL